MSCCTYTKPCCTDVDRLIHYRLHRTTRSCEGERAGRRRRVRARACTARVFIDAIRHKNSTRHIARVSIDRLIDRLVGWLYKSAVYLEHELLCAGQCATWHSRLQYLKVLQREHRDGAPSLPHRAHTSRLAPPLLDDDEELLESMVEVLVDEAEPTPAAASRCWRCCCSSCDTIWHISATTLLTNLTIHSLRFSRQSLLVMARLLRWPLNGS